MLRIPGCPFASLISALWSLTRWHLSQGHRSTTRRRPPSDGGQISDRGLRFSAGVLLSEYYLSGLASTTDFLLGTSPLEHRISSTDQPNRQGLLVPVPSLIINSRIEERSAALCSLRILAGTHPCLWPPHLNPLFQPVFLASLRRGRGPCMRVCADHGLLLGVWQ